MALESEKTKLKRLLVDAMLDQAAFQDFSAKMFLPPSRGGKLLLTSMTAMR